MLRNSDRNYSIPKIPAQFELCKVNGQWLTLLLEEETLRKTGTRNLLGRSDLLHLFKCFQMFHSGG